MFYKSLNRRDLEEICQMLINRGHDAFWLFDKELHVSFESSYTADGQKCRWHFHHVLKLGEAVWVEDIFTETKIQAAFDLAMIRLDEARKRYEEFKKERQEQARERAEKLLHDQLRALLEAQQAELRSETTLALEALELVRPGQWMPEIPIDAQVIKTAYRKAAKKHHPDAGGSESEFKRIHAAYERLQKVYSRS